ncbi:MAG: aspartate carbamoyltransferase [Leptospiraceae bacterium]|nr:aspartate carbamoyltransferase [Leptospiraceae bacterium]
MFNDLPDVLKQPVDSSDGVAGMERPRKLLDSIAEDVTPLLSLARHHIVSARQFTREQIIQLVRLAAAYETSRLYIKPLSGKILITAFYEPSTRTRLSFESAWHRLGGDVMSITDANTTGIAKGESLQDVAEMFSNYGDVVVLRDSEDESVYKMTERLRIPIVNAGNGIDEHPTQALADMYALLKWKPELCCTPEGAERIRIGIIGAPSRMRTLRSFLLCLTHFSEQIEVIVINPDKDVLAADQAAELQRSGLQISVVSALQSVLPTLDVVYINSIAWVGESYERLTGDIKLGSESRLKPDAIILHPLARGVELDTSLDITAHNWYFAQARGAVFIRMALLTCITQRVSRVTDAPIAPVR